MLGRVHPLAKLGVCLAWIVTSIVVFDLHFQLLTLALAVLVLLGPERRPAWMVFGLMVPFALFGLGFFTTSVLFREESGFALRMAQEQAGASPAVSAGLVLFFRVLACGMVSAVFALTTDPGALVKSLMIHGRLSPRVGFALFQAMALVPDLACEAAAMRMARAMRRGSRPSRIPGPLEGLSLIVPLLAFAIRRAGRAAVAMEARGLGASPQRTFLSAPVPGPGDVWFCAGGLGALAAVVSIALRL